MQTPSWLKHPRHYLFLKIFAWFWVTVIATITILVFLSQLTSNVGNDELRGPMLKNLEYTAKSIERIVAKHGKPTQEVLSHPRLSKHKLLYLNGEVHGVEMLSEPVSKDIDLSLLNFTKYMRPQIIFTDEYQAYGPVALNVPEGKFYLYEIDEKRKKPFFVSLWLMPTWLKLLIALVASLMLSFFFSRNLIAPINSLKETAKKLAHGDLTARADVSPTRQDELGVLGRDFNTMAVQLEQLISAQKRLLADISHELRSPLTRLKMATGLAQMQADDAQHAYLERIEKEANQLDKMIADVLQVSRLEAKSQTLALSTQSLQVIVDHVLNDAQFEAKQNNKELIVNGTLTADLKCDETLIASALENVLRNAIKYAEHSISIGLVESDAIYITVCDDGKGVDEANLARLCEPFFRQEHARDRSTGGTGLGLAIAKNAISAHDGTLTLENQEHGGLCVNIRLPFKSE
ncbi:two-component sensor histidine kinase [Pseudoalteromonas sp. S2721]|uniref:ATP-binding protein n=1 Tax=Pseudoalteromonas sp. S2721 TaxID=579526 RepID=UPI00110A2807|nr:ATP-binding protein [Pseudoalteromonas sp. S2721]TMP16041.1 two-component sensor histidine kinase [Pseudoalteromonas sp. S2721]